MRRLAAGLQGSTNSRSATGPTPLPHKTAILPKRPGYLPLNWAFPKRDHTVKAVRRVTGVIAGHTEARDAQRQLLRPIKRGQNIRTQNLTDGTEGF